MRGIAAALAASAAEFECAELALYTRLAVRCERDLRDADRTTRRDVAVAWCW